MHNLSVGEMRCNIFRGQVAVAVHGGFFSAQQANAVNVDRGEFCGRIACDQ